MRKPSASYWAERFNLLEQNLHDQGAAYFNRVGRSYDAAIRDLEKELAGWYSRYATENGITYAEAKKQLSKGELAAFKMDVEEYIEKGRSLDPQWRKQLEQASVRVHVSRLEAMKIQMQQNAELLAGETRDALDDMAHKVYSEKYYHTLYEIQKGVGVGFDCAELSDKKIKAAIGKTWAADGKHFSDRIWEDKARLVNELDTTFTQGVIRGTAPKKVIAEVSKRMGVKKSNVARLILTENKALQSRAELDGYKELGVNIYEIVATLDTRTSPMCREMDGKRFKRSEFEPGITAPPFHPYCRTCTVPYDEDVDAIFGEGEQRAARGKDGKYYRIPAKIKYKEWYEAFISGGDKTAFTVVSAVEAVKALDNALYPPEVAGVRRGEPMSFEEANGGNCNPRYSEGGGYHTNCQTCVVAYEARLRGYNVRAMPYRRGSMLDRLATHTNLAWIDPKTGKNLKYIVDRDTIFNPKTYKAYLEDTIKEGCRYTLEFAWAGRSRSGHIVHIDRLKSGELRIYDPQSGEQYTGNKFNSYLTRLKYKTKLYRDTVSMTPKLMRVDNAVFDLNVINEILTEA